ncbi:MAG: guanylate kinase, partial [Myxococcota bacterium]
FTSVDLPTLVNATLKAVDGLSFSVSATTRDPRPGEIDGESYHFLSPSAFAERREEDAFLEWARVYDREYGTLRAPTEHALASGQSLLLDIDVQGARQIRERMPEAVHIFVAPPSLEALRGRLEGRGTDTPQTVERRMALAAEQLAGCGEYDFVVVNDVLETAMRTFQGIVLAELCRVARRPRMVERIASGG